MVSKVINKAHCLSCGGSYGPELTGIWAFANVGGICPECKARLESETETKDIPSEELILKMIEDRCF